MFSFLSTRTTRSLSERLLLSCTDPSLYWALWLFSPRFRTLQLSLLNTSCLPTKSSLSYLGVKRGKNRNLRKLCEKGNDCSFLPMCFYFSGCASLIFLFPFFLASGLNVELSTHSRHQSGDKGQSHISV